VTDVENGAAQLGLEPLQLEPLLGTERCRRLLPNGFEAGDVVFGRRQLVDFIPGVLTLRLQGTNRSGYGVALRGRAVPEAFPQPGQPLVNALNLLVQRHAVAVGIAAALNHDI
jgi:hypothetical protein